MAVVGSSPAALVRDVQRLRGLGQHPFECRDLGALGGVDASREVIASVVPPKRSLLLTAGARHWHHNLMECVGVGILLFLVIFAIAQWESGQKAEKAKQLQDRFTAAGFAPSVPPVKGAMGNGFAVDESGGTFCVFADGAWERVLPFGAFVSCTVAPTEFRFTLASDHTPFVSVHIAIDDLTAPTHTITFIGDGAEQAAARLSSLCSVVERRARNS